MNILKNCLLTLLLLIYSPVISAQLALEMDYATFRYDTTQTMAEIYYAIPVNGLKYISLPNGAFQAQVLIRISFEKDGTLWQEHSWKMEKTVADSSKIPDGSRMVDVLRYLMQPATYTCKFFVQDINAQDVTGKIVKEFQILDFSVDDQQLSGIQLARSIKRARMDTANVFWKNGLEITPNPAALYSLKSPMLFCYLESYNLDKSIESDFYKSRIQIVSAEGAMVETVKPKIQKKKKLASSIEIGTLNLSSLASGTYTMQFDILDTNDNQHLTKSKKFFFYNPQKDGTNIVQFTDIETAVLNSEFATMTEKELDTEFKQTHYFILPEEKDFYKKLDNVEAKRKFIYKIWQQRDPNPATKQNEYRLVYKHRITEANKQFRSHFLDGWQTDRGRVFVLNGKPTDVERFPNNPTAFAHEIWHYDNIEGSVIFVFVDIQEFGEYRQVHSTKLGETMDPDWESKIQK